MHAAVHHPAVPSRRRLLRQLRSGALRRRVRPGARRLAGRHPGHRGHLPDRGVPRRAGHQPFPLPRPKVLHPGPVADPDAAGRRHVHRAVQDDVQRQHAQLRAGPDRALCGGRGPVHHLDAARLRGRRAGGAGRSRHGGRPVPHQGIPENHFSVAGPPAWSPPASTPSCRPGTNSPWRWWS